MIGSVDGARVTSEQVAHGVGLTMQYGFVQRRQSLAIARRGQLDSVDERLDSAHVPLLHRLVDRVDLSLYKCNIRFHRSIFYVRFATYLILY